MSLHPNIALSQEVGRLFWFFEMIANHCITRSSAGREDRNGNCAFINGNLPSMYGEVAEGREMQSFLQSDAAGHKLLETAVDHHKDTYVSISRNRNTNN